MTILPETIRALPRLGRFAWPRPRLASWAVSWLQVSPLAFVLIVLFALPTLLFFVVSFFDYDRTGIYPAFILDNYRDLLTTEIQAMQYPPASASAVILVLFVALLVAGMMRVVDIRKELVK